MIAVDTNVLVRFLVNDQPEQSAISRDLLDTQQVWVSKTVVLETEWVLRHFYRKNRQAVDRTFRKLLGLPNVTFEDRPTLLQALRWLVSGMDFADAFHLASSGSATSFATFDKALAKAAVGIPGAPEVLQL